MSSWAETVKRKSSDTAPLVREVRRWTQVTFQLDSHAEGETKIGFGRNRALVEPGSVYRLTLAPGTRIEVSTTSSAGVSMRIFYSEQGYIDDALRVLCQIAEGVNRG